MFCSGWVFLRYGLFTIVFGLASFIWQSQTLLALIMGFGALSLANGAVSLVSIFRKDAALRNSMLALSGLLAIALGVWFLVNLNVAVITIALWVGVGALPYGALQIFVALRLRKVQ